MSLSTITIEIEIEIKHTMTIGFSNFSVSLTVNSAKVKTDSAAT